MLLPAEARAWQRPQKTRVKKVLESPSSNPPCTDHHVSGIDVRTILPPPVESVYPDVFFFVAPISAIGEGWFYGL